MSSQTCSQANCNAARHIGKEYCLQHYKELSDSLEYGLDAEIKNKLNAKYDVNKEREAQAWIEAVTGEAFPGNFQESLKNGVLLCKLVNKIKPGSVKKITTLKSPFKEMENIANYLAASQALGMRSTDTFMTKDLYESANMVQVIDQIHSLGAISRKVPGFNGPFLGVKQADENKRNFTKEQLNTTNVPSRQCIGSYGYADESVNPTINRQIIKDVSGHKASSTVPLLQSGIPDTQGNSSGIDKIIRNPEEFSKNKGGSAPAPAADAPSTGAKFCGNCGQARQGSAKFCGNCGSKY